MSKLFLLLALAVASFLAYAAYIGELPGLGDGSERSADTVDRVLDSGRNLGRSTGEAFQNMRFPGK